MPTAAELKVVVAVVNANLAELVWKQAVVKDREEKKLRDWEVREAKEAKVGIS